MQKALDLADAFALRGADSVHLASALVLNGELGMSAEALTFVTSDQELKSAAKQAGLAVVDPQEQDHAWHRLACVGKLFSGFRAPLHRRKTDGCLFPE